MVSLSILTILSCALKALAFTIPERDYVHKNYFLVEIDTSISNEPLLQFIRNHDYQYEHQLQGMDNHFIFSIDKTHPHNDFLGNYNSNEHSKMKRDINFEVEYDELVNSVRSLHLLPPKKLERRMPVPYSEGDVPRGKRLDAVDSSQLAAKAVSDHLNITDPTFFEQWHLVNTFHPGHDVNVSGLWYEGVTGSGIVTAVVDDGLDFENPDLTDNFNAKGSWDFNSKTNLPLPRLLDDYHGTRCAGEIAAVKNDVCGLGVAYDSKVSGIRILSGPITGADEAAAMMYGLDTNDIYSCSWGPTDDGKTLAEPEVIVKKAMIQGVQKGRKDKGSVYVFASGNGGRAGDSCNFDGYTNSIYSITVGAIDFKGFHPAYAEACSAVMVVTYSSGSGEHIHTTDIHKKCSSIHGGTSAAAPLAAGIYALVLSANPNLTWRDVQYVSVMLSVPVNQDDGDYQMTASKRLYSHKYGYGKIDAYEMVQVAKAWTNVKSQAWIYSDVTSVEEKILSNKENTGQKLTKVITITEDDLKVSNVKRIEHVTVRVNLLSTFRGRVGIKLTSPVGVVSELAAFRPRDLSGRGLRHWTFMSVAHWGENGAGDWKLEVIGQDNSLELNEITLQDWQLRIFGESVEETGEIYDFDTDYALIRRERLGKTIESSSSSSTTDSSSSVTSVSSSSVVSSSLSTTAFKSGHASKTQSGSVHSESATRSQHDVSPTDPIGDVEDDVPEDGKNKHYTKDRTGQYFIGLAILGFVAVLLLMKFHKTPGSGRRRRRREEYEFDIIPGEDYSDSEEDEDSFDLGHHDDATMVNDAYEEPPVESQGHMFSIGDEEDVDKKVNLDSEVKGKYEADEQTETDGLVNETIRQEGTARKPETEDVETDALLGQSK